MFGMDIDLGVQLCSLCDLLFFFGRKLIIDRDSGLGMYVSNFMISSSCDLAIVVLTFKILSRLYLANRNAAFTLQAVHPMVRGFNQ